MLIGRQQLSHRRQVEGKRIDYERIWRPIRGRKRYDLLHAGSQPHNAATAQVLLVGDTDEREGSSVEGMPGVNDGYRFFRR